MLSNDGDPQNPGTGSLVEEEERQITDLNNSMADVKEDSSSSKKKMSKSNIKNANLKSKNDSNSKVPESLRTSGFEILDKDSILQQDPANL
jgi:hypothetical protein